MKNTDKRNISSYYEFLWRFYSDIGVEEFNPLNDIPDSTTIGYMLVWEEDELSDIQKIISCQDIFNKILWGDFKKYKLSFITLTDDEKIEYESLIRNAQKTAFKEENI